ncbi:ABC transporter ATP-binding protein [Pseudochelatococcus sp. B33]
MSHSPAAKSGCPSALLTVSGLGKRFAPSPNWVVRDVGFTVEPGEIFALIGPSGCGKTTTLRMIAGFETADAGDILLNGRSVRALPPDQRGIGIVFQDYALFPHLTVAGNVGFGAGSLPRAERQALVESHLTMVGLAGMGERFPDELSGGQQQRVALARTFAARPRLILLDEPFSNLDATLRHSTRGEIREILKATGIGVVFVTHDQEEALSFADRIGVMRNGAIEQIGTPEEVYRRPRTRFVAEFLGRTNLVEAQADGHVASTPVGPVALGTQASGNVLLSLRPENIAMVADPAGPGKVIGRDFKGHDWTYLVDVDGNRYQIDVMSGPSLAIGEKVWLRPNAPGVVLER